MAMQRWATFSVTDHLNVARLVPDVLLFDRLVFPWPADDQEVAVWKSRGWEADLLAKRLMFLGELALPFLWGDEQRKTLPTTWDAALRLPDPTEAIEFLRAGTRYRIQELLEAERNPRARFMPCYQSWDELARESAAAAAAGGQPTPRMHVPNPAIPPAQRQVRGRELGFLVGQRMALPPAANPEKAFDLAIQLARNAEYRGMRDDLNDFQEELVAKDQCREDDFRQFNRKVEELNKKIAENKKEVRKQWVFFVMKRAADVAGVALAALTKFSFAPLLVAISKASVDTGEQLTRAHPAANGPVAAFHHVRQRVIEPSLGHKTRKSRERGQGDRPAFGLGKQEPKAD